MSWGRFAYGFSARRAAWLVCALAILLGGAATARAQCPMSDNIGWGRGATVRFFLDQNLSAEQKRQARWALAEWNRANSVNNARVRFEEDFTGQNFQFRLVNGSLGGNTPAFANKQFAPDGTVVSATLTYDPNAVFAGSATLIANPAQPGYEEFIIKITLHEVGHTLGLDHPPGSENPCAQPRGASVMNYICNVNDQANNMPLKVTTCDQNSINSMARYPAFTQSPNPIDESQFFVRQHYLDFLNREPDAPGLAFWTKEITSCGAVPACVENKRVNVSAAFFLSIEFQETGYLVYRAFKAAFGDATSPGVPGTVPVVRLNEFLLDTQRIGRGVVVNQGDWRTQLEANKNAYALEFVQRARFLAAFPTTMSATQFVDQLNTRAGFPLDAAERQALINELAAGNNSVAARASVLRKVAEDPTLAEAERNRAFVLMQYFGYLRRNPNDPPDADYTGYDFWLGNLERFQGNFVQAELVKAFILSAEYRQRFAP